RAGDARRVRRVRGRPRRPGDAVNLPGRTAWPRAGRPRRRGGGRRPRPRRGTRSPVVTERGAEHGGRGRTPLRRVFRSVSARAADPPAVFAGEVSPRGAARRLTARRAVSFGRRRSPRSWASSRVG